MLALGYELVPGKHWRGTRFVGSTGLNALAIATVARIENSEWVSFPSIQFGVQLRGGRVFEHEPRWEISSQSINQQLLLEEAKIRKRLKAKEHSRRGGGGIDITLS